MRQNLLTINGHEFPGMQQISILHHIGNYGGPKVSRHKQELHGTNENFTAQVKTLTAEVNLTAEMAVYFTRAVTQSLKM